ncbi:hypothetical protein BDR26DRAFT_858370 [Obelidium mucronatum]|nr:hypothetical protein BDR26DRAFT_858370 [Obelidium mucronatum]
MSTAAQREKTKQFTAFTGADDATAVTFLSNAGWKVDQACDAYFQYQSEKPATASYSAKTSNVPSRNMDRSKLNKLFDQYKDADEDIIGVDGTEVGLLDGFTLETNILALLFRNCAATWVWIPPMLSH